MIKLLLILLTCFYFIESLQNSNLVYRCNYDEFKYPIRFANSTIEGKSQNKILALNSNNFKEFNISLDLNNLYYEIDYYSLQTMKNFFVSGLTKAKTTLEKLLKVRQLNYDFVFKDSDISGLKMKKWDTNLIGTKMYNQRIGMKKGENRALSGSICAHEDTKARKIRHFGKILYPDLMEPAVDLPGPVFRLTERRDLF